MPTNDMFGIFPGTLVSELLSFSLYDDVVKIGATLLFISIFTSVARVIYSLIWKFSQLQIIIMLQAIKTPNSNKTETTLPYIKPCKYFSYTCLPYTEYAVGFDHNSIFKIKCENIMCYNHHSHFQYVILKFFTHSRYIHISKHHVVYVGPDKCQIMHLQLRAIATTSPVCIRIQPTSVITTN